MPKKIPYFFASFIPYSSKNILLIGSDYNYDEKHKKLTTGRSDTLVFVNIDPLRKKVYQISIPRDSLVEIPGYGYNKINFAFSVGGKDLVIDTIEKLFNTKIDGYFVINLKGLVRFVDSLGGVKVYVDKDLVYEDKYAGLKINIKKGVRKLSGKDAEGFVRFRHDALGDIGRVERQKLFVKSVLKKISSPVVFVRLPFVFTSLKDAFSTNLTPVEMLKIGNFFRILNPSDIEQYTIPGQFGEGQYFGYWIVDTQQLNLLKKCLHL